jgi:hypothetical protein
MHTLKVLSVAASRAWVTVAEPFVRLVIRMVVRALAAFKVVGVNMMALSPVNRGSVIVVLDAEAVRVKLMFELILPSRILLTTV